MDRNEDVGGVNTDEATRQDEEKMDRAAQAGVEGAFGANPNAEQTLEQMREDATDAFSGTENAGNSTTQGDAGGSSGS
jgi:hypothetical protein